MNKLQELLISGRGNRPTGQFWYGPEGTRKTGSAVSSKTLFLDLERGSDQYDCERIHITTYRGLIQALDLIIHEKSRHEIIVVDPIEIAEKLLIGETCRQPKIDGLQSLAQGAAWQYLRENFDSQLMARFNKVRRTGRHMIVIGHSQVRTVTLPGLAESFDRYEPRIDKRDADTLVEWADDILFFDWDIRTAKNRDGVVRALSSNEPIVRVIHGAGWTTKNRVGVTDPLKPSFDALAPLFNTLSPITAERPGTGTPPVRTPAKRDSRTKLETPSLDEAITDPFLSDQESRTIEALLSDLPQERLLEFLRERGLIKADEDYRMLGPHFNRRILADPDGFKYLRSESDFPGSSLVTRPPGKFVEPLTVVLLAEKLGAVRVLEEYSHLSAAKYEKLCSEAGLSPDSAAIKQGAGAICLRVTPELTAERR